MKLERIASSAPGGSPTATGKWSPDRVDAMSPSLTLRYGSAETDIGVPVPGSFQLQFSSKKAHESIDM